MLVGCLTDVLLQSLGEDILAESLELSFDEITVVAVAILIFEVSFALLQVIHPAAGVHVAVLVLVHAITMSLAVYHIAGVLSAGRVEELPFTFDHAFVPLTLVTVSLVIVEIVNALN